MRCLDTIQKPKRNPYKTHSLKYINIMVIGPKCYWIKYRKQLDPISEQPNTQVSHEQPVHGPQRPEITASCYGLNVCCKWSPHYIILSLLKTKTMTAYFSTCTRGSKPSSLSLSKLLQHDQLTIVLHFTWNHEFWYCSRGRHLGKSSKTIGHIQDIWELGKYDENPMTHVHSGPKRTQGVAPRPRPVRVLLPLCWFRL